MSTLDSALFSAVQRKLLEPDNGGASFFTERWTAAELSRVATDRQDNFLKWSHLQIGLSAPIPEVADQAQYALPFDWIATVAVIRTPPVGKSYLLDLTDSYDADNFNAGWQAASGRPLACRDVETPTRTLELMPPPAANQLGSFSVYYVPRGTLLDGSGEPLVLPDELGLPALQYAILADLLGKVGRGQDLPRAAYCQQRVDLAYEVTEALLKGFGR